MFKGMAFKINGAALLVLVVALAAAGQKPLPTFPVVLQVPVAPTPFRANGRMNLVYELHATSFRAGELLLSRVEVYGDDGASSLLASYADAELNNLLSRPGTGGQLANIRLLGAGQRAVIALRAHAARKDARPRRRPC
jgi:hypothetical protein